MSKKILAANYFKNRIETAPNPHYTKGETPFVDGNIGSDGPDAIKSLLTAPAPVDAIITQKQPEKPTTQATQSPVADKSALVAALLTELASWVGTPYRYGAKQKGRGVDCSELIMCVCKATGAVSRKVHVPRQHADWIMNRKVDPFVFRNFLLQYCVEVPFDDRRPADIASFIYGGIESHVAMFETKDIIIHAPSGGYVKRQRLVKMNSLKSIYRLKVLHDGN